MIRLEYAVRTINRLNPQLVAEAWDRAVPAMTRAVFDHAAVNLSGAVVMGRSWRLRRSLKQQVRAGAGGLRVGRVWTSSPVGHLLERGVRPHEIIAKSGTVLRFRGRAGWRSASRVRHSGIRPRRFLALAAEQSTAELDAILRREIEAAAARPSRGSPESSHG